MSQRPVRDIFRRDYHKIVNYEDDQPTNPPILPASVPSEPAIPVADEPAIPVANEPAILVANEPAILVVDEPAIPTIPTTAATNNASIIDDILDNIYDDSDNDLPLPTLALSSIEPSESASQVPQVPRKQRVLNARSWVFDHFTTTVLDTYYLTRKGQKRTQDKLHKCKKCSFDTIDSRRFGTGNMIEHLKKHRITQFPASSTPQTLSVLDI